MLHPVDMKGNTPLHICARVNNKYMAAELLSLGREYPEMAYDQRTEKNQLEMTNNRGLTPFHQAIKHKNDEIVEIMLQPENDLEQLIRQTDNNLRTSLHMAAFKGK